MLNWVKKHRPPVVILENVCSAPWQTVVKKFEEAKYSAKSIRLDTKTYYVPHTRTRGYMMAVNAQSSSIPTKWVDRMSSMKRVMHPALSMLSSYRPTTLASIKRGRDLLKRVTTRWTEERVGQTGVGASLVISALAWRKPLDLSVR